MKSQPLLSESYKGYEITVWPQIHYPPFKDFYANAIKKLASWCGWGGIEGDTPELAMQAAKQKIDEYKR